MHWYGFSQEWRFCGNSLTIFAMIWVVPSPRWRARLVFFKKYFLTISTLMMFHTQYDRSYDGLDQYQEAEVLILLFGECIIKFRLSYISDENRCCFKSVILTNPVYNSSLSRLPYWEVELDVGWDNFKISWVLRFVARSQIILLLTQLSHIMTGCKDVFGLSLLPKSKYKHIFIW